MEECEQLCTAAPPWLGGPGQSCGLPAAAPAPLHIRMALPLVMLHVTLHDADEWAAKAGVPREAVWHHPMQPGPEGLFCTMIREEKAGNGRTPVRCRIWQSDRI